MLAALAALAAQDIALMREKPWLILTLRRTGGTSLTSALSAASSFATIEHEPFNDERRWGDVTTAFRADEDEAALSARVAEKLASRPNIKHCFEFLPMPITLALITQAQDAGYHIILLTRRNEGKRQLSLSLAMATEAWGPAQAAQIYPQIKDGTRPVAPIDLVQLRNRVQQDYLALGMVLAWLRNRQIAYDWLLFEELYQGDTPLIEHMCALAARIGIDIARDDPRLDVLARTTGQKSTQIAEFIPNYRQVVALLDSMCRP